MKLIRDKYGGLRRGLTLAMALLLLLGTLLPCSVAMAVEEPAPVQLICDSCGSTLADGEVHTCPPKTLTCEACGGTYAEGDTHTCPPKALTCETCSGTYTDGEAHECPICESCESVLISGQDHTCPEPSEFEILSSEMAATICWSKRNRHVQPLWRKGTFFQLEECLPL